MRDLLVLERRDDWADEAVAVHAIDLNVSVQLDYLTDAKYAD